MNDTFAVAPLTKVTLHIAHCQDKAGTPKPASPVEFDFIFGIATEGLTAFEKMLIDKIPGDRMRISIKPFQMNQIFEYLSGPLVQALGANPPFEMEIVVTEVSPVSNRELVQALAKKAELSGSGCGGGCGCGC